ncbi:MAG: hypothetical protein ACK5KQ_04305 [Anaerorhabdus sp.]
MENIIDELYMTSEEIKLLKCNLVFAKELKLIVDDSIEAIKVRCDKLNKLNEEKLKNNEVVFGLSYYPIHIYAQYELTNFKLEFISKKVSYNYKVITKKEKQDFYNNNNIFTRCNKDKFKYDEVEAVIEKRLREIEYDKEINRIFCKLF